MSGHRNNSSKREELTSWSASGTTSQETEKQSERARGTHFLEIASGGTSQITETIRASEGHSRPGEHGEKTSQDMETILASEEHSQAGQRIRRDRTGHRKNLSERVCQWHSPTGNCIGRDKSGHGRGTNHSKREALTDWRTHREGQVMTQKQSN
jgi:hypothetical protein